MPGGPPSTSDSPWAIAPVWNGGLQVIVSRAPKICLHAIKLRLDGWPPREVPVNIAAQVLAMAGVDVTPEQLERVLPAPTKTDAQYLLGSRSVVTQATALLAAAKDPWWDEQLERLVVFYTTNADPRLRGAAYRSLGQLDPDLWASAMLVHVADFDPDPLVRQEAPRLRR